MNIYGKILEMNITGLPDNHTVEEVLECYSQTGIMLIPGSARIPTRSFVDSMQTYKHCAYCDSHRGGEDDCKSCGARKFIYKER